MMEWFKRRILKRIKQKHPVEVYINGKLVIAGVAVIEKGTDSKYGTIIKMDRYGVSNGR